MTSNEIIALLLFIACLAGRLAYDTWLYQSRKVNNHVVGPAITLVVIVACCWLAGWLSIPMWFFGFAAIFDPSYAVLIGQKPGFLGTTAKLDRLQHRYPPLVWVKYIGAVVAILLFIFKDKMHFVP